ncbi:MAG: galactosyltransferase-related protein [Pseudorhodoferax sp.]
MPITPRRPITVSIVSHGQQGLIVPLLEQLNRFSATSIETVVLTVNIQELDLIDDAAYSFPIRRIVNPSPRGFGTNHNAAFVQCDTTWFLVLNPDMRLETDVIGQLLGDASSRTGLLAPRIFEPGKHLPEPHRGLITPCEILKRRIRRHTPPERPAWIPGMFMLFRSQAFRDLKGFNERYFMYGEDFDICARLRLADWNIDIDESLSAVHAAQRASHRQARHLAWHMSSLFKVWLSPHFWNYKALLRRSTTKID